MRFSYNIVFDKQSILTEILYQVFNGLALMTIAMHPRFSAHKFAGPAIAAGGAVFSVSRCVLSLERNTFLIKTQCTIFALVLARDK
jgi:hypothetical protein